MPLFRRWLHTQRDMYKPAFRFVHNTGGKERCKYQSF
uniref:Uncharacterized protein n=1 Tax=Utricularia reniformis TaxID=192314 RepID=A0A1Y0B3G1_9LAMI|nr:hypothetical protein AEK19_MT1789 [Utricularia reniformis]ART31962.1 hypothetical protein AEK19_MT1789 [Utricularia reniformis]